MLNQNEAPLYVINNEYIFSGYRDEMPLKNALISIFSWHNETLNIWSHIIGALIFLLLALRNNDTTIIIYQVTVAVTLLVSVYYHTVSCVSEKTYELSRKSDFTMIAIVMYSMFIPFCYHVFGLGLVFYTYIIGASCFALACINLSYKAKFQTNEYHTKRAMTYVLFGIFGLIPVLHAFMFRNIPILIFLLQFLFQGIGAFFYASKFPERVSSKFDYVSSHFVFHICIVLGFLVYNYALSKLVLKQT